jgi:VWFA-related protein
MTRKILLTVLVALLCLPIRGQQPQDPKQKPAWPAPGPTPILLGEKVARPQQRVPPPVAADDVVRITTNLVQVDAVVTKDDKQVIDLKAEDFEILEDGKPQTVSNLSYIWSVPPQVAKPVALPSPTKDTVPVVPTTLSPNEPHRTIAMVVDDLGISFESIGPVRSQLRKFIQQDMRDDDLVAIIRTGGEVGALQQFTTDKRLLLRAVENLRWNHCSRVGIAVLGSYGSTNGLGLCSDPRQPLGSTINSLKFILQGMRELAGRKSMVIFSENLPTDIPESFLPQGPGRATAANVAPTRFEIDSENATALNRVAELAIRASVVIYGADTSGLQPIGPTAADYLSGFAGDPSRVNLRPTGDQPFVALNAQRHLLVDNRTGLELLSRNTGGFVVKNSNNFQLRKIAQDQEGYYLIGYRPQGKTFNRRFHHITLRVKRPGLKIRTRSGFFGMTDEDALPVQFSGRDRVGLALMSPFGAAEIEVHLTALFANFPQGSLIRSLMHFPVGGLTFTDEPDGSHQTTLNLSCVVFGDNGRVVKHVTETRQLRIEDKGFEQVQRNGLVYQFDVPIKDAGGYQFRVAVRDGESNRIGTAREFIDVPELKKRRLVISGVTLSGEVNNAAKPGTISSYQNVGMPAIRRFPVGANLLFGYVVYNAQLDKATHLPILTAQARIFHEGQVVYTGPLTNVDTAGQADLGRMTAGGGIQLGSTLEPGDYILQIIVNDPLAKEKYRSTSQWIDFQIVK